MLELMLNTLIMIKLFSYSVCCEMIDRRRAELPNEDEDDDDDTEFAPGKKIKLENAVNSTGIGEKFDVIGVHRYC